MSHFRRNLGKAKVKLAMVVGGTFDIVSGNIKRAPKLFRSFGLEWLFRLIQQPFRWKRQLKLLKFWQLIFKQLLS